MIEVIKAEDIPNLGDCDIDIYNAIIVPRNATNGDMRQKQKYIHTIMRGQQEWQQVRKVVMSFQNVINVIKSIELLVTYSFMARKLIKGDLK